MLSISNRFGAVKDFPQKKSLCYKQYSQFFTPLSIWVKVTGVYILDVAIKDDLFGFSVGRGMNVLYHVKRLWCSWQGCVSIGRGHRYLVP